MLPLVEEKPVTDLGSDSTTSGAVGGGVSGAVDVIQTVLDYCKEPKRRKEIQDYLGIKSERYVREEIINPLVKDGRLKRTIPDKPNSSKQRYVAAEKE